MPSTRIIVQTNGLRGPKGDPGANGTGGTGGGGVPNGGTTGQGLLKLSNADQDTGWGTVGGSGSVAGDTHAATSKATPVDADELPLVDSAASFGLKKLTIANLKALLLTYLNSVGIAKWANARLIDGVSVDGTANVTILPVATHAATAKTTPASNDEIPLADSAASYGLKKYLWSDMLAAIGVFMASVSQTVTNKNFTSGTNTFPTFTDATKVPTTRTINGLDLTADRSLAPANLAIGTITDAQQYKGNVIAAFFDGLNWVDAAGTILTGRPTARTDATVFWIDRTPTGAGAIPTWALTGHDVFLQSNGATAPSALLTWYGTALANAHAIVATDAGTGDSPPVTSVGGTTAPTINTGALFTPAVSFAQAAAQVCNLHFTIGSTQPQGRVRFWFQTPSAWYTSSQAIFRFTDAADALLAGITLRGSGAPGELSINDSTSGNIVTTPINTLAVSTWYRIEFVIDQTAGTARLFIYNTTGALIYDSTASTMSVGSSGWSRCVWGPTVGSVTTAMLMAKLKITADPTTPIGPT